jgi:hypothetical protein
MTRRRCCRIDYQPPTEAETTDYNQQVLTRKTTIDPGNNPVNPICLEGSQLMPIARAIQCPISRGLAAGLVAATAAMTAGCAPVESEVATMRTIAPSASSEAAPGSAAPENLDQYGRAQVLEGCLVEAGLPAQLTPVEGGEMQIDWEQGHEVLARDFEQITTLLDGPAGEINPGIHDAFMDVEEDPVTLAPAPALWIDGKDHTDTWVRCLESSHYTNPAAYLAEDADEALAFTQRFADATNDWMACAREHGLPELKDVRAAGDNGPLGPHAEIPLSTEPALLRTVIEACPIFSEDLARRRVEGDPTVDEDIRAGRTTPDPLVYAEEPEGAGADENYDFESGEGKRYVELNEVLFEASRAFEDKLATKQARIDASGQPQPVE